MVEDLLIVVTQLVILVFLYGLLRWRIMQTTHPFRIQVGREAKRLSSDDRVTERSRKSLDVMADMMYRPIAPWLVVIALVWAAFQPSRSAAKNILSEDKVIAKEVLGLKLKLIFALITTSPLACLVGAFVMAMGLVFRSSVVVLSEVISAAGDGIFMMSPATIIRWER